MLHSKKYKATSFLSLDVGKKRIGVALARHDLMIPRPLITLNNDSLFINKLTEIVKDHEVDQIIVGIPRNLNSKDTKQTEYVRKFAKTLEPLGTEIKFQDEALTSVEAEEILKTHVKSYNKEEVDALAALIILEDYINEVRR